jgi:hypothetical protein
MPILCTTLLVAVSAAAQPVMPRTQSPSVADALSSSPLPENSSPSAYLRAAQGALAAGRLYEAQEALEMAQTRLLDRSVPLGQTRNPSNIAVVGQISQALQALAARDRANCMQWIDTAMTALTAQGL